MQPMILRNGKSMLERLREKYDEGEARELVRWILEETTDEAEQSAAVERLLRGEPVQQVFGHTLWMDLDLRVTRDTLIPRPETAELVETIGSLTGWGKRHAFASDRLRVLDIGTGTGCIAIALKQRHPEWKVSACDISAEALRVAEENALRNDADVEFFRCDILHEVPSGTFDIVVSNPPYVCENEKSTMESRVLDYEPASALFVPDNNPLLFYKRISDLASGTEGPLLAQNGIVVFEINERFGEETATLLRERGFRDVEVQRDMFGKDRIVYGRWSPSRLYSRAAAYCSTAEHCKKEVAEKLNSWGEENEEEIARILERLSDEGFIDETRYARAYANDKLRFQGWGRQKIRMMLQQKGVTSTAITEALAQLDEDEYRQVLQTLAEKKRRELRGEKDAFIVKQKIARFLAGRGFSFDEISCLAE